MFKDSDFEEISEYLLYLWYTSANQISYRGVLQGWFKGDKKECNKILAELIEEGLIVEEKNPHSRAFSFADSGMALRRCDKYILSGKWKFDDKKLKDFEEKQKLKGRGSPKLRNRILSLLFEDNRPLCMEDSKQLFDDYVSVKRREKMFTRSVGKLVTDGYLRYEGGEILLSDKGASLANRVFKNRLNV